ncbi:type II secretion system F family protein [Acetivibrio cellulolyticus]|uniref:type II secretion system F family protein n=1 Tax=Acetivibrio cellulolyticus TaxID=35830 RepID=UPI0001E2DE63|nr:type II secretion system F family protein [Acetivibrio cellulolyticus]
MATYNYRAKTVTGNISAGKIDATDKNMVVSLLKNRGLYPLEISELNLLDKDLKMGSGKKIPLKDLSVFCKQFYTMADAGVTIIGSLDLLRRQTENRKLANILSKVYEDVQKGMSLSEAMKVHKSEFPTIVISMIEIGEISGNLDTVLDRLATYLEKDNKVKQKIKTSMVYPKAIGGIAIVAVIFMMIFVVPNFITMFKGMGSELPLPTRILLAISDTFKNIWFLLGASIVIPSLVIAYKKFIKTERGKYIYDKIVLGLPIVGKNMRKIIASRFSRSLSLMLKTGVPLIQALEVVGNLLDNEVVNKGMIKVKEDIKRGSGLAEPLEAVGIFPVMVTHMISIGEEAGSLDSIVEKVADFYDDELDASIGKILAMLEPLMIVAMAVVIGGIVIAMILPIFSMYQNVT